MTNKPNSNLYFSKILGIGEILITEAKEEIVWTVLGSCISIILYVENVVSMICHSQLPNNPFNHECTEECPHPCNREFNRNIDNRFVKCSLENMISKLHKYNFNPQLLRTTIVGGASIIPKNNNEETIGEKNVATAKKILLDNNIKLNREKTGGLNGYNLWYHTDTNRLFLRVISDNREQFELFNNK